MDACFGQSEGAIDGGRLRASGRVGMGWPRALPLPLLLTAGVYHDGASSLADGLVYLLAGVLCRASARRVRRVSLKRLEKAE
jgi:hypothetical protein